MKSAKSCIHILLVELRLVLGCFVFLGVIVPLSLTAEERILEKIYYYVNDEIITKLDFEEAYNLSRQDPSLRNLDENVLSNTVISNLITEKAISYHAELEGIRVREGDVESEVNRLMQQNNIRDRGQFELMLSTQGISKTVFERQIRRNLLIQRYVSRKIDIEFPTDNEVRAYYDEHKETDFKIEKPLYYLSWIFLKNNNRRTFSERKKTQNRAEEIRNEILDGVLTFKAAVEKYSEDEVSKANGGVLGWRRSQALAVSEVGLNEMGTLPIGAVTSLYSSETGVFFYKIEDRLNEGYIPYRVATQEIRELIVKNRREKAFNDIVQNLHQISYIKPNVDKFDLKF